MWGCLMAQGVGYACHIDGHMDVEGYTSILEDYLLPMIEYYKLDKERVIFQHDNDPKYTSHTTCK